MSIVCGQLKIGIKSGIYLKQIKLVGNFNIYIDDYQYDSEERD